jgi:uncharacterized protein
MGASLDTLWVNLLKSDIQVLKATLEDSSLSINDKNRMGITVLHRYAFNLSKVSLPIETVVNLLVDRGIDVNAKENGIGEKRTPLHIAALVGSMELCQILIHHGALIDPQDKNGNTPLWSATMSYNNRMEWGEVIECLLNEGANPHLKNYFGHSPLDVAIKLKGTNAIKYFERFTV